MVGGEVTAYEARGKLVGDSGLQIDHAIIAEALAGMPVLASSAIRRPSEVPKRMRAASLPVAGPIRSRRESRAPDDFGSNFQISLPVSGSRATIF